MSPAVGRATAERDDRGALAVELAFLAPTLLMLIFFVIQAGLYFYGRSVALQAAREGVAQLRVLQTQGDYETVRASVAANVVEYASHVGSGALNSPFEHSTYDDAAGKVSVEVTGQAITLVPGLTLHISQQASGRIERFGAVG